ncbi:MAG: DUF4325 domain-containing protein [bacterium]
MNIFLEKFGTTLISRQAGKEAFSAFKPTLNNLSSDEKIEMDFKGVITFSPSWGDEFLRPLVKTYNNKVILKNTENLSVKATLEILEKIGNMRFDIQK